LLRPKLRPVPAAVAVSTARHSTTTPLFAPSRDEDQSLHRPVRARGNYPTPVPTPWRIEALQKGVEKRDAPRFPALPDEVASHAATHVAAHAPVARASIAAHPVRRSPPPLMPVRQPYDSSDLVGAWPTLPAARVPALRVSAEHALAAAAAVDPWPALLSDADEDGTDPDLSLPAGHRERLDREQRGQSWNG
ncbi:MAG TPA: hypothetical protein VHX44_14755, partial [Planctomycetota bacterium]|nr:hypothetical protein [Planctomycetota bacterium]